MLLNSSCLGTKSWTLGRCSERGFVHRVLASHRTKPSAVRHIITAITSIVHNALACGWQQEQEVGDVQGCQWQHGAP